MGHEKDHPLDSCNDHTACTDCEDCDASSSKHGLMPKADKIKLDGIAAGAEIGNCSIAVGTYTGDGTTGQEIDTGVSGQIQYLSIYLRITSEAGTYYKFDKVNDSWGDYAFLHWGGATYHQTHDNRINSLSADGKFVVDDDGINVGPNADGEVYSYVALIG